MAALVQSFPQQAGTTTILQTRPSSASGMMSAAQAQGGPQYGQGLAQQRGNNRGMNGMSGPVFYRGSSAPIQPYAFTSTPSLTPADQWQQARAIRTVSTSSVPTMQAVDYNQFNGRPQYSASVSMTNLPASAMLGMPGSSRDDSALPAPGSTPRRDTMPSRPSYAPSVAFQPPSPATASTSTKASPERYRRPAPRPADSQGSGSSQNVNSPMLPSPTTPPAGTTYNTRTATDHNKTAMPRNQYPIMSNRPHSFVGTMPGLAADDMQLYRVGMPEEVKRVRRRSMPALEAVDFLKFSAPLLSKQKPEESPRSEQAGSGQGADKEQKLASPTTNKSTTGNNKDNNNAVHARTGSNDSRGSSSRSTSSNSQPSASATSNSSMVAPTGNPARSNAEQTGSSADYPQGVNVPPRSSSSDVAATKRAANPSPLSKPVAMNAEGGETAAQSSAATSSSRADAPSKPAAAPRAEESQAVKQLAAINEKGGKPKSKTSRLRRAFSFGSAAELKKVLNPEAESTENAQSNAAPSKLHKEPNDAELYDAEQARIAQRQEEAGIGNSIYSGGRLFSASTDNISISSTASSASIMIRKMGRGLKKGSRSLVGLFRPKSIIGAPAPDSKLPETTTTSASEATVSMVTIEAERDRVNVNVDPHAQNGGGTGFPHLERNSIDATKAPSPGSERLGSSGTDTSAARKSIIGGEKERAEVLAAVRKGILKHPGGSPSPSPRPTDGPVFDLPNVTQFTESPVSSAPSTPNEESQGHKRTGSVALSGEDYFMSALRLRQDTKSNPGTPQGTIKRNATFSPRIVFYDTWPSQEYDRRGEIATCNRLTPMLAQQIKEELNSFKMEMEVHENSKIYTHFF